MTQTLIRLLADGLLVPIVLFSGYALVFWIPKGGRFEAYKRIFIAGLTTYLIAKLMGAVYQPSMERPFELLGIAPGASYLPNPGFPSDHALFAVFLTVAVWFETRRKSASIILVALTILMCIGRILALVHTPLDIVGGIFVALLGALWYLQGSKETRSFRKKPV
ncbi:MAG TPA: phosphatase PAP2 family protein [Candidatus Saccharimonadales bacterium]|nr:phosphatase PAP2 family protein [Candidatus Saccharimonadales bacterium]